MRILVKYGNEWRPIWWFMVKKNDKSIYLGPRLEKISELKKGSKQISNNQTRINYCEGEKIDDPDSLKVSKVSFHSSGIINHFGDRSYRNNFRNLKQQEELCLVLFTHPTKFVATHESGIRKRDVCLNYHFDEDRPLQAFLFISPKENIKINRISSATNQLNLLFIYNELDLVLQIILTHGVKGPWPPFTYMLFKSDSGTIMN